MFEVQKHITVTNHGYLGYAVIVNKNSGRFACLDIRFELEAAMKAATRYANDIAQQENDQAMDTLKAMPGLQVYYPGKSERAEWQRADACAA
jgi:C4-dicarboxylate-binding protein DctP